MARVRFHDREDHCVGVIDIHTPGTPGRLSIAAVGDDRADALGRAALVAERIANDPIMRALMPPQAQLAITAAKGLAAAAKRGMPVLKSFWSSLHGPGKQRLAQALANDPKRQPEEVGISWKKAALFAANPFAAAQYYGGKYVAKKAVRAIRGKPKRVPPMQRPEEQYDDYGAQVPQAEPQPQQQQAPSYDATYEQAPPSWQGTDYDDPNSGVDIDSPEDVDGPDGGM